MRVLRKRLAKEVSTNRIHSSMYEVIAPNGRNNVQVSPVLVQRLSQVRMQVIVNFESIHFDAVKAKVAGNTSSKKRRGKRAYSGSRIKQAASISGSPAEQTRHILCDTDWCEELAEL